MPLNYQTKDGIVYAKDPGVSYRTEKGIRKKNAVYLGRVIDKENNIFYNKKRGVFHYDINTHTFSKADDKYISVVLSNEKPSRRPGLKAALPEAPAALQKAMTPTYSESRKQILDFGDAFFLDTMIKTIGYDEVLKSIRCDNTDTLMSLLLYSIITGEITPGIRAWRTGSYAGALYPDAKLSGEDLRAFLRQLGKTERQIEFFSSHNRWLKKNVSEQPAILIESRSASRKNNFPDGARTDACTIFAVQKDSGYPMLSRLVHGTKAEVSSLNRTVTVLSMYGVKTSAMILDSFLFSGDEVDQLFRTGIDFISAVPAENQSIWNAVTGKALPLLKKPENLVKYNGRSFYILPCKMMLGARKTCLTYAYLGADASLTHEQMQGSGLFLLLTSKPYRKDDILTAYGVRRLSSLFSLSGKTRSDHAMGEDSEDAAVGRMMLSQMAAAIRLRISEKLPPEYENLEEVLMALRNQKCEVFSSRISPCKEDAAAAELYESFRIKCPEEIRR